MALVEMSNNLLSVNDVLRGGIENRPGGQQPVQNTRLHNNLKQFSKVGFKEAKAWMERRLAAMKNGVPKAVAAELARDWLSSLNTTSYRA